MRVGVIADTHGVLHPAVPHVFRGVAHIVHAGDVGSVELLDALARLAPVTAIRGNADPRALAALPARRHVVLAGVSIVVVHEGLARGRPTPELATALRRHRPAVAVFGHSHVPLVARREGVLFLNPGGGGRRRFRLPRSVAILTLDERGPRARIAVLDDRRRALRRGRSSARRGAPRRARGRDAPRGRGRRRA
ncbi:MAG TPA: metallophosphoesterase family protein [Candidatus Binatia bacterium]|nr:metallophosphoesterase family protein [Candidatus Binatia bacterium]